MAFLTYRKLNCECSKSSETDDYWESSICFYILHYEAFSAFKEEQKILSEIQIMLQFAIQKKNRNDRAVFLIFKH